MSELDMTNGPAKGAVKTLAIRLEPELHAQLSLIAQLRGSTITDEIRAAIEAHLTIVKQAPELADRAEGVLADIDREAAARRDAIAALFGAAPPEQSGRGASKPAGRARQGRSQDG